MVQIISWTPQEEQGHCFSLKIAFKTKIHLVLYKVPSVVRKQFAWGLHHKWHKPSSSSHAVEQNTCLCSALQCRPVHQNLHCLMHLQCTQEVGCGISSLVHFPPAYTYTFQLPRTLYWQDFSLTLNVLWWPPKMACESWGVLWLAAIKANAMLHPRIL